jgi:F-type H+-transporting ATPase subunit delta
MMQDTSVAGRYARALFIVTEKRGETTQALEDLKGLWNIMKPGTPVGRLLATPMVLLSDKRKVLMKALEGKVLHAVVLFIDLLLRKTRLHELQTIVTEYEALVERKEGIQRAAVTSAVPLSEAERATLHRHLERTTGKKIRLTSGLDTGLVGGALVRIGDRVVDRSVQALLAAIERQLMETSV